MSPQACRGLVLAQPSGGARRRLTAHRHFTMHMQYVQENGLEAVVELARAKGSFPQEPAAGPWAAVLAHDANFAAQFVQQLEECIPGSDYWNVHLESQPPDLIRDRILAFFAAHAEA